MKKNITVLVVPVGAAPRTEEIAPTLEAMQAIVGGYIECVGLNDGVDLFCNEEGKLNGLPLNDRRPVSPLGHIQDIVAGDFFLCRADDEGEAISLTPADLAKYTAAFQEPA